MKKDETKTELMHIRIEPTIKASFEKAAKADGRTMAGAVQFLMRQYVEEHIKKKSK